MSFDELQNMDLVLVDCVVDDESRGRVRREADLAKNHVFPFSLLNFDIVPRNAYFRFNATAIIVLTQSSKTCQPSEFSESF